MSERYSCQVRLFGKRGQSRLQKARVTIVGIGGLGTVAACYLARAGVGRLELVDRDVVEESNLNRQLLFAEDDVNRPKAAAAAERLKKMNGSIKIKPTICDFPCKVDGPGVILDCSDNLETRFAINKYAVKKKVPLIYGAASGWTGAISTILPGKTACLKCVFPGKAGPKGCDATGVSGPLLGVVGSLQASEAIKYFLGEKLTLGKILYFDILRNSFEETRTKRLTDCQVCGGEK